MARLIINNYNCDEGLVDYKVNLYDLQDADSGDRQDGFTQYNLVRKDKVQLTLSWSAISEEHARNILRAVEQCERIPVTYKLLGEMHTAEMCYRGDREIDTIIFDDSIYGDIVDLKMNMIEQ